ncbi:prophage p2 ogr protein [Yersinia mollaretii]|nr:prophage p2 ogr protein [Yersinia mollaretii]CQR16268.1 prophage p2 ogr protein [Yersinia mollaretii]
MRPQNSQVQLIDICFTNANAGDKISIITEYAVSGVNMMHCPRCKFAAHARSSRYLSDETKERYHQCTNINCGKTFKTHETIVETIMEPGIINAVPPHPKGNQGVLWM